MIGRVVRGTLWLLGIGAFVSLWFMLRPSNRAAEALVQRTQPRMDDLTPVPAESLDVMAARDVFRFGRTPARIAYDPVVGDKPPEPPPAPPRPMLVLTGIVWSGGAASGAVVEGLPGVEGPRWIQTGDTAGGVRVRRIGRSEVVLAGWDTVWTLKVGRPWE